MRGVSCEPVVARGNPPEVFQPAKGVLDATSLLVGFLVEAERLLPVAFVGDDGFGAAVFQPLAQFGAVVSLVAQELFRRFVSADQAFGHRTIMCLAARQKDGKKTAFSICYCVDLRIAPASPPSNRLFLLPPFPPQAERSALMCVESIIFVSFDRPRPASSRNSRSHTPRSAQRTKRL